MPHLLIVDDEPFQHMLIKEMLHPLPDLTFEDAYDGVQALALARARLPELALIDVMIPLLDGFATCRLFKDDSLLKVIPILLTTLPYVPDQAVAIEAGADDFIGRPFVAQELRSKVLIALRQQSSRE